MIELLLCVYLGVLWECDIWLSIERVYLVNYCMSTL